MLLLRLKEIVFAFVLLNIKPPLLPSMFVLRSSPSNSLLYNSIKSPSMYFFNSACQNQRKKRRGSFGGEALGFIDPNVIHFLKNPPDLLTQL